ncbi:hypothetical protein [Kitasatospora sp. NPDC059571]|uniref:hypothetical protein n=1 Tax=Kitasatospora sp. NPDC059571 TaxID=3346871 RepID=UPI0036C38997
MEPTPAARPAASPAPGQAPGQASAPAAQGTAKRPGRVTRTRAWLDRMSMSAVVFWVALSMGLLLVVVQTSSNWMLAFCSAVWAITAVVLVGRFDGQHAGARRRSPATP